LIIVYLMGELVDARTAAQRLGVDVRSLYAYVSRGSLRRIPGPDGRSSRYDCDELELLARRSRPRTLPRPAASIDLVIATRVSTVSDGVVRYRGKEVAELVAAGEPFERVADLLWRGSASTSSAPTSSAPRSSASTSSASTSSVPGAGAGWRPPATADWAARLAPRELPVLQRLAIAVAAMPALPGESGGAPDWPGYGRRLITCITAADGGDPGDSVARRVWRQWSPLRPTAPRVRALNAALVLLAEHELALSTLAVRVAASARAAPAGCVLAGLSALSGALHGGAPKAVHEMLLARQPVTAGFGHVVHARGDPRTAPLLDAVCAFATPGDRALIGRALAGRPAAPNVDFALGALSYCARMPAEGATAIFAIARAAGWVAHAAEEYGEAPLRFRGRAIRPGRALPSR
jgi:citrate synthase